MSQKSKTLFEHLSQITHIKKQNYWEDLSEGDKKTFSQFMLNRFLSMEMGYVDLVDYIQTYKLPDEMYERLMRDLVPKKKIYNKYMKGKSEGKNQDVDILAEHLKISRREAFDYYETLKEKGELKQLENIKKLYGQRFETS